MNDDLMAFGESAAQAMASVQRANSSGGEIPGWRRVPLLCGST